VSGIVLIEKTIAQAKNRFMTQTPTLFIANHSGIALNFISIPSSNNGGFFIFNNSKEVNLKRILNDILDKNNLNI
jgi:hypothetical protein